MKIREIYEKYQIPNNLQQHQLRVAAVAGLIAQNIQQIKIDAQAIQHATLLHDMGNIIKFNFDLFPEFRQPQGIKFWQTVKAKFISLYGDDEHQATKIIAKEIGVSDYVIELIDQMGFSHNLEVQASADYNLKICSYADKRVGPHGVISMKDRIEDGVKRFIKNKPQLAHTVASNQEKDLVKAAFAIEEQIFTKTLIRSEEITDQTIEQFVKDLEAVEIA